MEIESFYYSQFNGRDTVLIVDDAEVNREILKLIFEDKYKTLEAADGVEGLALLRQYENQVCMILLDVVMPKMDGLEFLEHFSKLELQNQIPVFLITADGSDQVTRRAYEMGVMDVIQKPIVPYVVKRRVDSVVELFCARACRSLCLYSSVSRYAAMSYNRFSSAHSLPKHKASTPRFFNVITPLAAKPSALRQEKGKGISATRSAPFSTANTVRSNFDIKASEPRCTQLPLIAQTTVSKPAFFK